MPTQKASHKICAGAFGFHLQNRMQQTKQQAHTETEREGRKQKVKKKLSFHNVIHSTQS